MSFPENQFDRILLIAVLVIVLGELALALYGDISNLIKGYGKTRVVALKCILNLGLIYFLLRRMTIGWVIAYSIQLIMSVLFLFLTGLQLLKEPNPPRARRIETVQTEPSILFFIGFLALSIFVFIALRNKGIRAYFNVSDRTQRITTWVALGTLVFLSVFGMGMARVFQRAIPV